MGERKEPRGVGTTANSWCDGGGGGGAGARAGGFWFGSDCELPVIRTPLNQRRPQWCGRCGTSTVLKNGIFH